MNHSASIQQLHSRNNVFLLEALDLQVQYLNFKTKQELIATLELAKSRELAAQYFSCCAAAMEAQKPAVAEMWKHAAFEMQNSAMARQEHQQKGASAGKLPQLVRQGYSCAVKLAQQAEEADV